MLKEKKFGINFLLKIFYNDNNTLRIIIKYFINYATPIEEIYIQEFIVDVNNYKSELMKNFVKIAKTIIENKDENNLNNLFDLIGYLGKYINHYFKHHVYKPKRGDEIHSHEEVIGLISHIILIQENEFTHNSIFEIVRKEIDKSTMQITASEIMEMVDDCITTLNSANMIIYLNNRKYITKTVKRSK